MTDRLIAQIAGSLGSFSLDARIETPLAGVTALYGPSGSGKTTLLRCIAGLQHLPGRLTVGEDCWQDDGAGLFRPAHQRAVGYVFQEASLFSHLTVRENLNFGLQRARRGGAKETIAFDDIVSLLALGALLGRAPANLSGGERQRVAVARALLSQPRLLLMDEPLSALDRATKDELLPYFDALERHLAIPIVYVTHDLSEVERLASRMILMDRGRILAIGPLAQLETDPALPLVGAREAAVMLEGRVAGHDARYNLTTLSVRGADLIVPGRLAAIGAPCRVRIGVSDVSFTASRATDTTILNCLPATIVGINSLGAHTGQVNIVARLDGGAEIVGRVTRRSQEALGLQPGKEVFAQIKSVTISAS